MIICRSTAFTKSHTSWPTWPEQSRTDSFVSRLGWMACWMIPWFVTAKTSWIAPHQKQDPDLGSSCCERSWDGRAREQAVKDQACFSCWTEEEQERWGWWMLWLGGSFPTFSTELLHQPSFPQPNTATLSMGAPHASLGSLLLWVSPPHSYKLQLTSYSPHFWLPENIFWLQVKPKD